MREAKNVSEVAQVRRRPCRSRSFFRRQFFSLALLAGQSAPRPRLCSAAHPDSDRAHPLGAGNPVCPETMHMHSRRRFHALLFADSFTLLANTIENWVPEEVQSSRDLWRGPSGLPESILFGVQKVSNRLHYTPNLTKIISKNDM